jgi:hypothetical protein
VPRTGTRGLQVALDDLRLLPRCRDALLLRAALAPKGVAAHALVSLLVAAPLQLLLAILQATAALPRPSALAVACLVHWLRYFPTCALHDLRVGPLWQRHTFWAALTVLVVLVDTLIACAAARREGPVRATILPRLGTADAIHASQTCTLGSCVCPWDSVWAC